MSSQVDTTSNGDVPSFSEESVMADVKQKEVHVMSNNVYLLYYCIKLFCFRFKCGFFFLIKPQILFILGSSQGKQ